MKKSILIVTLIFNVQFCLANGLLITETSLENFNESEGLVDVKFRISWGNSWRIDSGPSNWDAAWIFIKYRSNNGPWQHATLNAASATNYTIFLSDDQLGAFLHRAGNGSGNNVSQNTLLSWDIGNDGVSINDTIEVKVFGIEMVYVPESAFWIGTNGGAEVDRFSSQFILSENEITVNYGTSSSFAGDGIGLLPEAFPKGFNAFYCMKYEISEEQYIAFFNTLTPSQKIQNDLTGSVCKNSDDEIDGNTISWLGIGTEATSNTPERACSFMTGIQFARYLDWAALRPMTELEFEKATRGPGLPNDEAYAWGTSTIISSPYSIINSNLSFSSISGIMTNEGRAAYNLSSINYPRPVRCGLFSNLPLGGIPRTREQSGSSYYGIMELSGNLAELVISIGNTESRTYNGEHGDGAVGTQSSFIQNNLLTRSVRGGSWIDEANLLRISDRTYGGGGALIASQGQNYIGGRGVRTAD